MLQIHLNLASYQLQIHPASLLSCTPVSWWFADACSWHLRSRVWFLQNSFSSTIMHFCFQYEKFVISVFGFYSLHSASLLCHVFTGVLRPLVLFQHCTVHSVSHPGIRGSKMLISVWFVWPWKLLSMLGLQIQTGFLILLWFCLVFAPFLKKAQESLSPRLWRTPR